MPIHISGLGSLGHHVGRVLVINNPQSGPPKGRGIIENNRSNPDLSMEEEEGFNVGAMFVLNDPPARSRLCRRR